MHTKIFKLTFILSLILLLLVFVTSDCENKLVFNISLALFGSSTLASIIEFIYHLENLKRSIYLCCSTLGEIIDLVTAYELPEYKHEEYAKLKINRNMFRLDSIIKLRKKLNENVFEISFLLFSRKSKKLFYEADEYLSNLLKEIAVPKFHCEEYLNAYYGNYEVAIYNSKIIDSKILIVEEYPKPGSGMFNVRKVVGHQLQEYLEKFISIHNGGIIKRLSVIRKK